MKEYEVAYEALLVEWNKALEKSVQDMRVFETGMVHISEEGIGHVPIYSKEAGRAVDAAWELNR